MRLQASIADYRADIQIADEGSRLCADLDGRRYEIEVRELGPGRYLFTSAGRVYECRVAESPQSGKPIEVSVGAARYAITLTDPKRLRGSSGTALQDLAAARIVAPMSGKIVRLLVQVGDEVEAGAGVVVVEAMKMQNEMKTPKAGVVVALNVKAGATVNGGDVLAVIE
jgi:biotin carboxyl carrier protein